MSIWGRWAKFHDSSPVSGIASSRPVGSEDKQAGNSLDTGIVDNAVHCPKLCHVSWIRDLSQGRHPDRAFVQLPRLPAPLGIIEGADGEGRAA